MFDKDFILQSRSVYVCLCLVVGWLNTLKISYRETYLIFWNIEIYSFLPYTRSLIIASHHHTLYIILVVISISENIYLWHVAAASTIFVTFAVFVALFLFQSPKPLLQHSLLVGLITAPLSFITSHLRIL